MVPINGFSGSAGLGTVIVFPLIVPVIGPLTVSRPEIVTCPSEPGSMVTGSPVSLLVQPVSPSPPPPPGAHAAPLGTSEPAPLLHEYEPIVFEHVTESANPPASAMAAQSLYPEPSAHSSRSPHPT